MPASDTHEGHHGNGIHGDHLQERWLQERWLHEGGLRQEPRPLPAPSGTGGAGPLLLAAAATAGAVAGAVLLLRRPPDDWRGRVALVTGGTRGFGLLMARELAAAGCALVVCARDEDELWRAEADLRDRGACVLAVRCDVSDEQAVGALVDRAIERFGRIDVLVNNAGAIEVGPVEQTSAEDFRRAHAVIFAGAVHCTLAVLPHMLRRGSGHVINVSSLGGRIAVPHLLPYDTAKFALTGFSEGLRTELGRRGIRVTTVFPGMMRTGSYRRARFKGGARDYEWFALASALPVLSMDAERAARATVHGARRRRSEVVVPLYARLLTRLHGIAPGTTNAIAALLARLLPGPVDGAAGTVEGAVAERQLPRWRQRLLHALTALGRRGGRRALQPDAEQPDAHHGGEGHEARANVGGAERAVSGVAGGLLVLQGLRAAGFLGLASGAVGAGLLARAATGRCAVWRALGVDTAGRRARDRPAARAT